MWILQLISDDFHFLISSLRESIEVKRENAKWERQFVQKKSELETITKKKKSFTQSKEKHKWIYQGKHNN